MDEGCTFVVAVVLMLFVGFVAGCNQGEEWGRSAGLKEVACPSLLAAQPTLADSLTIAQTYEECEWWAEPKPPQEIAR